MILLAASTCFGSTITINSAPYGNYIGPYTATVDGIPNILVFCLDENKSTNIGQQYNGSYVPITTQQEQESAFLVAGALFAGGAQEDRSLAIWFIMGTLEPSLTPMTDAANQFVVDAENAFTNHTIPSYVLENERIFVPNDNTVQRFMTDPVPEPLTIWICATGLMFLGLFKRRKLVKV